jgi:hypothetical protein
VKPADVVAKAPIERVELDAPEAAAEAALVVAEENRRKSHAALAAKESMLTAELAAAKAELAAGLEAAKAELAADRLREPGPEEAGEQGCGGKDADGAENRDQPWVDERG